MDIPADLRYSTDHEWIRQDGDTVTVGITEFAQDSLGDVVFIDIPDRGDGADQPGGDIGIRSR